MKKIKVFALLVTLFVSVFSNLLAPTVYAAEENVSITLHKVKDYVGDIENTGDELPGAFNYLPGITFKAYDVTEEYYTAYNVSVADNSVKVAIDAAVAKVQGDKGVAPLGKTEVGTQTTNTYGSATFLDLPAKSGTTTGTTPVPRDAVYLFVEQPSDGVASTSIAENLVVSLPIYKQGTNDTVLKDIHLYPKNTTKDIPFDKAITNAKNSEELKDFSIGQTINYQLKTTIPADIAATKLVKGQPQNVYNFFKFVDTFQTSQLTFINEESPYSVTVAGETELTLDPDTDYTVEVTENADKTTTVTTALTEAGIKELATHANKEITFDYQMKINSLEYIDTPIVNTAQAIFGNDGNAGIGKWDGETPSDSEKVITGGYKFVKVDVNNNDKTLAGAEFFVRKSTAANAEYFVATADGGVWTTVESVESGESEATKYTTGNDGIVDVKGLEYGTYQLQETKAPEGYALPTGDAAYTQFVVTENSYTTTSTTALKIVNTPKGFLPSTGGAGIILFVALGAAMVGLAGVYFTSRRKVA